MKVISFNKIALCFSFSLLLLLVFSSNALAQTDVTAPNPGDPIIIDGKYSDGLFEGWDFVADYYADMYRASGNATGSKPLEAIAYTRINFATNTFFVLVKTTASSPNIITKNMEDIFVKVDNQKPDWNFAWIGLNQDGTRAEAWEASFPITEGTFTIQIHTQVESDGSDQTSGTGNVTIEIYRYDLGDLPDSYGTLISSNGPKHTVSSLRLGLQIDGENNGQPSEAILDNTTGRNDEDGVEPIGNWLNVSPTILYTVNGCSANCYLNMWIDWDGDTMFNEPYDLIFTDFLVTNGTHIKTFPLPYEMSTFPDNLSTRVRLCDSEGGCATPHALSTDDAPFGEVEDYQWSFTPNAIRLNSFAATSTQNEVFGYIAAGLVTIILLAGSIILINKRNKHGIHT